ncbi:AHH domain-containing protein [Nioella sp. MMSF_3534]|uniref:AHH domain-containing protein n=1 Tax=Nioella sp. MMSF_3534 TaxID=3046720 RepID=UPI0035318308
MPGTQNHHVLPTAVYLEFRENINRWTNNDYQNNAGYNRVELPISPGAGSSLPGHSGSHPGLSDAWRNVLRDIRRC